MIYIDMGGGRLGNQFFRYAFAKKLQKYNPKEKLVFNFDFLNSLHKNENDGHENSLRYFNTKGTDNVGKIKCSLIQCVLLKIYWKLYPWSEPFKIRNQYEKKWVKLLEFFGLYYLGLGYHPFRLKKPWWVKNIIVNGCWESEKYFSGIEDEIRAEFVPSIPVHEHNRELLDIIRTTNSVAISIRRGDFTDNPDIKNIYCVCNKKYYYDAIDIIKGKINNPVFIFFSNDIEWVKNNIKIEDVQCYYESGSDEVWETFRLMSSCKNFIISNSTLHWWAQFCSNNSSKIVVAPSRWYNIEFNSELYQNHWILVDV